MRYLDKFISLTAAQGKRGEGTRRAVAITARDREGKEQVALIPSWEQKLKIANAQLVALETAKAKDVIALQRQLSNEKNNVRRSSLM